MFIDEVTISLIGGKGGAGKVSFYAVWRKGPDGGNGGNGGNVYVQAVSDLTALKQFSAKKEFKAEDGVPGGKNLMSGKNAPDLIINLPVGVSLTNLETGKEYDLTQTGQTYLISKGGKGGKGNYMFRSSTNTTPRYAQPGEYGEAKTFKINLKLIADFGLIGLPNAGKSSLLNELTSAHAKTANYPFTTLEPNLGVFEKKVIADIPGLIEGASAGKGLGTNFLKHIEKVTLLLHCIAADSPNPLLDYQIIKEELKKSNPELLSKREIILLTKTDLIGQDQLREKISQLKKTKQPLLPVSIHDFESIEQLKKMLNTI